MESQEGTTATEATEQIEAGNEANAEYKDPGSPTEPAPGPNVPTGLADQQSVEQGGNRERYPNSEYDGVETLADGTRVGPGQEPGGVVRDPEGEAASTEETGADVSAADTSGADAGSTAPGEESGAGETPAPGQPAPDAPGGEPAPAPGEGDQQGGEPAPGEGQSA